MARANTINAPRGGKARARALRAVGYVRRSTDRQEQSIPDQKRAIEQYAAEHSLWLLCFASRTRPASNQQSPAEANGS